MEILCPCSEISGEYIKKQCVQISYDMPGCARVVKGSKVAETCRNHRGCSMRSTGCHLDCLATYINGSVSTSMVLPLPGIALPQGHVISVCGNRGKRWN